MMEKLCDNICSAESVPAFSKSAAGIAGGFSYAVIALLADASQLLFPCRIIITSVKKSMYALHFGMIRISIYEKPAFPKESRKKTGKTDCYLMVRRPPLGSSLMSLFS